MPEALVPLLRGAVPLDEDMTAPPEMDLATLLGGLEDQSDPHAAGRGIIVGLLLSVPLWTMIGLGVYWVRS